MIYRVRHQTIYDYAEPVSLSHHVVRLTPRDLERQRRHSSELTIWPATSFQASTHIDYFGNEVTSFTLPESHSRMSVEATSELEVQAPIHPKLADSPAWETVRATVPDDRTQEGLAAFQFVFDSSRIAAKPALGRLRARVIPRRAAVVGSRRRPHRAHPPGFPFRRQGHRGHHPGRDLL